MFKTAFHDDRRFRQLVVPQLSSNRTARNTPMYDTTGRIRPMVSQRGFLLAGDGKVNQQSYRNLYVIHIWLDRSYACSWAYYSISFESTWLIVLVYVNCLERSKWEFENKLVVILFQLIRIDHAIPCKNQTANKELSRL